VTASRTPSASPTWDVADVLVDAKQLRDALRSDRPPVLLDVRWALGDPHGRDHYRTAHLPGAVYVDLETELSAPPGPRRGRHPLPELSALEQAARRWGLSVAQAVVVYDDAGGLAAARAWWLLRWAGVRDVRILDGALAGWIAAGFETEQGEREPAPGDIVLTGGHLPVIDADEAAALATEPVQAGALLDARAAERYRGEVEPIDPRAGHIPGALSAPTAGNLSTDGTFRPVEELRTRFAALGIGPATSVGVYCGSGVTAAHEIAALASVGINAALYPGSWSAWSADPNRPASTGAAPTAEGAP
jgi:thiosulfate/3-mercaptopyruvate sulfurtransferase